MIELLREKPLAGIVRLYKTPECTPEDFKLWWPRLTMKEKARYTQTFKAPKMDKWHNIIGDYEETEETENLLTNNGVLSVLQFWCFGQTSQLHAFQQILSMGNGAISSVNRTDTAVAGDAFVATARKAPTAYNITGFQGTHSTQFSTTDAVGTWSNGGMYGYNFGGSADATTTAGTGWLNTHFLISFVKPNGTSYTLDYIAILSN